MKSYRRFIAILLSMFLLSGCGSTEPEEVQVNIPSVDWKINGFAVSGEIVDEQGLWAEQYIPWTHEGVTCDEQTESVQTWWIPDMSYGDKIYRLNVITELNQLAPLRCQLEIYDTSSMEIEVTDITLEQLGLQDMEDYYLLTSMDVIGDRTYAFQVRDYIQNEEGAMQLASDRLHYLNPEGTIESAELLPVYTEKGILDAGYGGIMLTEASCLCDADGNSYVRDIDMRTLCILDREGKLLLDWKCPDGENIFAPMKTAEGELIYPVWSNRDQATRLIWFDLAAGQERILAELQGEWVKQLYGMQGNNLYYENRKGIVRWNVASGTRQLVFRLEENGVSNLFNTMLVMRDGELPVLRTYGTISDEEEDWLVVLSEDPVERPDAVRIVSLTETSSRVKTCAAVASRRNPNFAYTYEDNGSKDLDDYRTRIIAELVSGKGPDILYVSQEDMEILQKRGLLADIRPLLSEETISKVIPGVVVLGTVDGTLVGMAPGIHAESLVVGKSVWAGDSWTLDDMLELMESGKLENKVMTYSAGPSDGNGVYYASLAVDMMFTKICLETSFLIDWENRESHFDDERFIRFLKCVGKYDPGPFEGWDGKEGGGASLMAEVILSHPISVAKIEGTHGAAGGHYVGLPTDGGNGNYLFSGGMLVVNKNASDLAAVSAYLESLWGKEIQDMEDTNQYSLAVTYPSTDDIRRYDNEEAYYKGYRLTVFEDGTTAVDEAIAFLKKCVPGPKMYADLEAILYEELNAYWKDESRTAEDTARQIDRRVQVYLDEGN